MSEIKKKNKDSSFDRSNRLKCIICFIYTRDMLNNCTVNNSPPRYTTLKQRRYSIESTSRRIDIELTLFQRYAPAWLCFVFRTKRTLNNNIIYDYFYLVFLFFFFFCRPPKGEYKTLPTSSEYVSMPSREHTYIIVTPLKHTFI